MTPLIYLALPCYGGVAPEFMGCMLNLVNRLSSPQPPQFGIKIEMNIGDSIIGRARNRLVSRFMATECSHLMFIDTDLLFAPEHIQALVTAALSERVPAVTAAAVALRIHPPKWNYTHGTKPPRPSGLCSVPHAGTGFMLIDRAVFKETAALRPDLAYPAADGDIPGWNFFSAGINAAGNYVGEDYAFCELVRSLGFPVFVHPAVQISHIGPAVYPLATSACSPPKATP